MANDNNLQLLWAEIKEYVYDFKLQLIEIKWIEVWRGDRGESWIEQWQGNQRQQQELGKEMCSSIDSKKFAKHSAEEWDWV